MIRVTESEIRITGNPAMIMAETASLLNVVYTNMIETFGEEEANRLLSEIGRMAVTPNEELADLIRELEEEHKNNEV